MRKKILYVVSMLLLISMICGSVSIAHGKYANEVRGLPVLMYHSVSNEKCANAFIIPVWKFRQQMHYLKRNGYTTLSINDALSFLNHGRAIPEKSVLLTFDDGYGNIYSNAFPILKKFGFKASVFIITATIDRNKDYLTSWQLKFMSRHGIDIESHTLNHGNLKLLSYEQQFNALMLSRNKIERLVGKKVLSIAYPYGEYNCLTLKAAKNAGYKIAFTTTPGYAKRLRGLLNIRRIGMYRTDTLNMFKNKVGNYNLLISLFEKYL